MGFEMHTPWWTSGYGDGYATVVALVPADTEDDAWAYVRACHDKPLAADIRVRFCSLSTRKKKEGGNDETPIEGAEWPVGGDRFQRSDWMVWRDNMPKFKTLSLRSRATLYKALKAAGHWYIVDVGLWGYCRKGIPGVHAIAFDGYPECKFQVLGNGWLRFVWLKEDQYYIHWNQMGIKVGTCLPVDRVCQLIEKFPFKTHLAQNITIAQATKILKEKK